MLEEEESERPEGHRSSPRLMERTPSSQGDQKGFTTTRMTIKATNSAGSSLISRN